MDNEFKFGEWLKATYEQCSLEWKHKKGVPMSKLQFSLLIGEPYSKVLLVIGGKYEIDSFHVMQRYVEGIVRSFPNVERPF